MTKPAMIGKRFGKLVVVAQAPKRNDTHRYWKCQCDCGNVTETPTTNLNSGKSKSCGCYRGDSNRERSTHGMTRTRLYRIWNDMRRRCDDPTRDSYPNYGGRGIRYHPSFSTFEGFLNGIPDGYRDDLTIDRIYTDGDYEPGNLRWATKSEQQNNKRNNHLVELGDGVRRTLAEASGLFGVPGSLIGERIREGWSDYDAVTTLPGGRRRN